MLRKCNECQKETSGQAPGLCPQCGAPQTQAADVAGVAALVVFGVPIAGLVAGVLWLLF